MSAFSTRGVLLAVFAAGLGAQTWTQLNPIGAPSGRSGAASGYDSAHDRLIIVGGAAQNNDVWVLAGASGSNGTPRWTQLQPSGTPPPAATYRGSYDAATNQLLLFPEFASGTASLWRLTNANGLGGTPAWFQAPVPNNSPSNGPSVYDPVTRTLIVLVPGSSTSMPVWFASNATGSTPVWTQIPTSGTPPPVVLPSSVSFNPTTGVILVFAGGFSDTQTQTSHYFNGVYALVPSGVEGINYTWSRIIAENAAGSPSPRAFVTSAYDPSSDTLTVFGGSNTNGNVILGDTWVLSNASNSRLAAWRQVTSLPAPSARTQGSAAFDPNSSRVMLFGGNSFSDSWVFGGPPTQTICSTVAPSAGTIPAAGGGVAFQVTAQSSCGWSVSGNPAWLVCAPASFNGSGTVGCAALANTGLQPRSASFTIGGNPVSVTQAGGANCTLTLGAPPGTLPAAGSSGSLSVSVPQPTCTFSAGNDQPWLHINAGSVGSGNANILWTADPNSGPSARSATLIVSGPSNQPSVTFTQSGVDCTLASAFTLSPSAVSVSNTGSGGGSITVNVTTPCSAWGAGSDSAWLQASAANTGSGNGTIQFKAQSNTAAAARTGKISVGPASVTVTQDAGSATKCFYTLSSPGLNTGAGAASGSVDVTATAGCPWTLSAPNAPAGMVTLGTASGTGSLTATFNVSANAGTAVRKATLVLQGPPTTAQPPAPQAQASFLITQAGSSAGVQCTVTPPANPRAMRYEGVTELTDDLVTRCTGQAPAGSTANFTLKLNTDVTSRLISAATDLQTTEALLAIYPTGSTTPAQYRGLRVASNTLVFPAVALSGTVDATFRFTNLRADASQRAPISVVCVTAPCPFLANFISATLSASSALPIAIPSTPVTIGSVNYSLTAAAGTPANGPGSSQATFVVTFSTGAGTPFRPGIAVGQDPSQPGQIYLSESGFVSTQSLGATTGFATNGTRLRVLAKNVPAGVKGIYAQATSADGGAVLVTADSTGAGGGPVNCAIPNLCVTLGGASFVRLDPGNAATWEVQTTPSSNSFAFNVVFDGVSASQVAGVAFDTTYAPIAPPALAAPDVIPRFASAAARPAAFSALSVGGVLVPKVTVLPAAPLPRDTAGNATEQLQLSAVIGDGSAAQPAEVRSNLTFGGKFGSLCTPTIAGVANPAGSHCSISPDGKTAVITFDVVNPNTTVGALVDVIPDNPATNAIQYCDTISTLSGTQPPECVVITPVTVQAAIAGAYVFSPQYTPGGVTQMPVTFPVRVLSSGSSLVPIGGVNLFVDPGRGNLTFRGWADGTTTAAYAPTVGQDPLLLTALYSDTTHNAPARLTSPVPGTPLGSTVGFTWTAVSGATQYQLIIGSQLGASDLYGATAANKTSDTVSGLPQDGRPLFVRIRTLWTDTNQAVDYLFQASGTGGGGGGNQGGLLFVPLSTPCRAVDTRSPSLYPASGAALSAGEVRVFALSGVCGIPAGAAAYSLNVTVVPSGAFSYLTLWPSDQAQPFVSTLNSFDGRIRANAAIVPASAGGSISAFVTNAANLVFDIDGYFVAPPSSAGLAFYPVTPCRVADTRFDAVQGSGVAPIPAGGSRSFPIGGGTRCGIPAGARAYSLNVTAVPRGTQLGYLTAWPNGAAQPFVSTLNAPTGAITANAALMPAGTGGISVFVTDSSDVVLDINGYFGPAGTGGLSFYKLAPCRVSDTRDGSLGAFGTPSLAAAESRQYAIPRSKCGPPATARAWSLNATVVPAAGVLGYLTLWPADQSIPLVSTLNSPDGAVLANAAIVPGAADGSIRAFVTNATDLVLDLNGYFAP